MPGHWNQLRVLVHALIPLQFFSSCSENIHSCTKISISNGFVFFCRSSGSRPVGFGVPVLYLVTGEKNGRQSWKHTSSASVMLFVQSRALGDFWRIRSNPDNNLDTVVAEDDVLRPFAPPSGPTEWVYLLDDVEGNGTGVVLQIDCIETHLPTQEPTDRPSEQPTVKPSEQPTIEPTAQPSVQPTVRPSEQPSIDPTLSPSEQPTFSPTTGECQ